MEALYRVYITAVLLGVAVWLLSGVTGDVRVDAATVQRVTERGPQVVGAVVGAAWAVGLRAGGRGGPLVIEAADVRHVLLSPVDRAVALLPIAIRQLRFGALVGAGAGALGGLLAYRRLPGGFPGWAACGAGVGLLAAVSSLALAMIIAGHRRGRWVGSGLALVVAAWSAADVWQKSTTSPATLLGQAAVWPLRFRATAGIGIVVAVVVLALGLRSVAGSSIEAAERRSTLVGQIRFAATLRDLRTVVVLRRQLSQELPRQRPWLRLTRSVELRPGAAGEGRGSGRYRRRHLPVWRRSWHGILRFPALRVLRLAILGTVAGAACLGAWRGTTPLVVVAGVALYVAALDAVEPLAQEMDHPDRRDEYSVPAGELALRQLGPSAVVMVAVAAVGWAVAVAASGGDHNAVVVGAALVIPAGLTATAAAAISVVQGAPSTFSSTDTMLPPEFAGFRAMARVVIPPVVATAGVLPLIGGRSPGPHATPAQSTVGYDIPVAFLIFAVAVYLRYRDQVKAYVAQAMEEAGATRRGGASQTK